MQAGEDNNSPGTLRREARQARDVYAGTWTDSRLSRQGNFAQACKLDSDESEVRLVLCVCPYHRLRQQRYGGAVLRLRELAALEDANPDRDLSFATDPLWIRACVAEFKREFPSSKDGKQPDPNKVKPAGTNQSWPRATVTRCR